MSAEGIYEEWRTRPYLVVMKTANPGQERHEVTIAAAIGPADAKSQALADHPRCWVVEVRESV